MKLHNCVGLHILEQFLHLWKPLLPDHTFILLTALGAGTPNHETTTTGTLTAFGAGTPHHETTTTGILTALNAETPHHEIATSHLHAGTLTTLGAGTPHHESAAAGTSHTLHRKYAVHGHLKRRVQGIIPIDLSLIIEARANYTKKDVGRWARALAANVFWG